LPNRIIELGGLIALVDTVEFALALASMINGECGGDKGG
jgi:hypothetical protein